MGDNSPPPKRGDCQAPQLPISPRVAPNAKIQKGSAGRLARGGRGFFNPPTSEREKKEVVRRSARPSFPGFLNPHQPRGFTHKQKPQGISRPGKRDSWETNSFNFFVPPAENTKYTGKTKEEFVSRTQSLPKFPKHPPFGFKKRRTC